MRHWIVMMLGSTLLTRLRAVEAMARLSSSFVSTFMQVKSRFSGTLRSIVTLESVFPMFLLSNRFSV